MYLYVLKGDEYTLIVCKLVILVFYFFSCPFFVLSRCLCLKNFIPIHLRTILSYPFIP
jgi:hypothetical protein